MVQRVVKISKITLIYKNNQKIKEENQIKRYLLAPEIMSPWFCGAKSALLHNSLGQRTKSLWFCGAKNKGFVILRGKVCIAPWFRGAKSALLHNFAEQRQIFKSKNTATKEIFFYFFERYFDKWMLFPRFIAPWWLLFTKKYIAGRYL